MKNRIMISSILFVFMIIASVVIMTRPTAQETFLKRNNLNDMSVIELVNHLEYTLDLPNDLSARITASELLLGDNQGSTTLALPEDLFYLSIAPYINQTHPCEIHNLVGCRGELQDVSIRVVFEDLDTKEVLYDETVQTSVKGFAGIWLPRGKSGILTVHYDGLSAVQTVFTLDSSMTCLTTLALTVVAS